MKKIFLILSMFFFLGSCGNRDLIIQKANKNCDCSAIIEFEYDREIHDYLREHGSGVSGPGSFDCSPPFYTDSDNYKLFTQTSTLELKNNSQTKVYQVLIQINESGKIRYQEYKIEPTEEIQLGCDSKFDINFKYSNYETPFKAITLSNLAKGFVKYKIHEIKLLSEY